MANTKNISTDTLYITLKVIDRSLLHDPDTCSYVEPELENIKRLVRDTLDILDSNPNNISELSL